MRKNLLNKSEYNKVVFPIFLFHFYFNFNLRKSAYHVVNEHDNDGFSTQFS